MSPRLLVAALVGLATVSLAACGSADDGSTQGGADSEPSVEAQDLEEKPEIAAPEGPAPDELAVTDLVVGEGSAPSPQDTVTVHYVGVTYAEGEQFDASWDRGAPATFSLQQVIPGFQLGIAGDPDRGIEPMHVGGRRRIVMPADMAYGDQPQGGAPAGALIFVVDLIQIG